jgi:FkbM family methyltransferase
MNLVATEDFAREYERLATLAAAAPGAGRAKTLGWDLEYTSPDALMAFVDQTLCRRLNDFLPDTDAPVILDCGANIGYTSLHYKRLYPRARITAFEPDPAFVPLLRRNLSRNGAEDVAVVAAAAWTRDGVGHWVMEGKDGSRLVEQPTATSIQVPTVDLARYLDGDIDLLKIDIEGAEFQVVPHLAPLLHRVKNILVECHLFGQSSYRDLTCLMSTLTAAGFSIGLNSYGPWRDLIRQPETAPLHAEQYMLLAGWRTESARVCREHTARPYIGLAYDVAQRRAHAPVERALSEMVLRPERRAACAIEDDDLVHEGGYCWRWRCPEGFAPGDSVESAQAPTVLLEDDRVLGEPHSVHEHIRTRGQGRYSHWESHLYFSTSDGSDPRTNGRRYVAVLAR